MTRVGPHDIVVYEVALNEHPLVVGEDDDRSDEGLVAEVAERTETADDIDWPEWTVFESDPPGDETLRYVNTASRINVRVPYDFHDEGGAIGAHKTKFDVGDAIAERVDIEGFDIEEAAMSHWGATHEDDFNGVIHLDLTSEQQTFEEELVRCPDCGERIILAESIESNGEGVAFGRVRCESCPFSAREEWVHDQTVRLRGGDEQ